MTYDVVCADVLEWAAGYEGEKFHAMLCDPPYDYNFMGKDWDDAIAMHKETWAALAEHLLPGGFVMAFAGARTWHRQAVAIEDAGLIMHPSIFGWAYGSGFPKATRIDTQIDKANGEMGQALKFTAWMRSTGLTTRQIDEVTGTYMGNHYTTHPTQPAIPTRKLWKKIRPLVTDIPVWVDELVDRIEAKREVVGKEYKGSSPLPGNHSGSWADGQIDGEYDVTAPATDLAAQWQGHRYGLQAMKPACEPLLIFTKPLRVNLFCGIMTEITFLMEVLSCIHLNAQDAENLTNHLHQRLRAAVDNSAQENADDWASLGSVTIAGDSSASSLAGLTLADFVAGPVPTPDAMRQVVSSLGIGEAASLSAKDTDTYGRMADTLQSIVWLWNECLGELSIAANTSTTEMATVLTTDLKILKLCLRQIISDAITQQSEPTGKLSFVHSVESLLRSLVVKLPLLKNTTAIEGVSDRLVQQDSDQEESPRDGASLSPILLFQKPWEGKRLDCIVETGAGALNVDQARIGTEDTRAAAYRMTSKGIPGGGFATGEMDYSRDGTMAGSASGRWPANFTLTHVPPDADGNGGCVRDGVRRVKSDKNTPRNPVKKSNPYHLTADNFDNKMPDAPWGYADADGRETVANWACVAGCPVRRLGEQSGESVGSHNQIHNAGTGTSQSVYGELEFKAPIVQAGYNDKGSPARFFYQSSWSYEVAERLAAADAVRYQAKAGRKERDAGLPNGERSNHPTVKPIKLTQWLATLLLPPDAYAPRRILVPFAGSGSEALGALLAGWEHITLVEMDADYCDIARARLAWWAEQANGQMWPNVKEILKNAK